MNKKNLILSAIKTYPYEKIAPFVESLNKTSFKGDLILFCSEISKFTKRKLVENNVKIIEFENKSIRYQVSGAMNFKKNASNYKIPLMSQRFLLYLYFILKNKDKYENIMLTDIDVIFQKDPFNFDIGEKLCCFLIGDKIKETNQKGIDYLPLAKRLGEKRIKKYQEQLIACAGTTLGPTNKILEYLEKMKKYLDKGNDQAIHNYLIYYKKIKKIRLFKNGNVVLTVFSPEVLDKLTNIKNDKIYNRKGKLINIIHEYNRHPKLEKLFGITESSLIIKRMKQKPLLRKILSKVKESLYAIPLLGKMIRKKYIKIS